MTCYQTIQMALRSRNFFIASKKVDTYTYKKFCKLIANKNLPLNNLFLLLLDVVKNILCLSGFY